MKKKGKILGGVYRGTDYLSDISNHPVPIELSTFIELIDYHRKVFGCDYFFLATEVEDVVKVVSDEFGDKCLFTAQLRYSKDERRLLSGIKNERYNDAYLKGLEYLEVLYLLSMCDGLVGQNTGTFDCARMLNGGKYEYIVQLD